jgi:DNA-binding response OmpR family regulator
LPVYDPAGMASTILIVEDEHAVARGIQYALQQEG